MQTAKCQSASWSLLNFIMLLTQRRVNTSKLSCLSPGSLLTSRVLPPPHLEAPQAASLASPLLGKQTQQEGPFHRFQDLPAPRCICGPHLAITARSRSAHGPASCPAQVCALPAPAGIPASALTHSYTRREPRCPPAQNQSEHPHSDLSSVLGHWCFYPVL